MWQSGQEMHLLAPAHTYRWCNKISQRQAIQHLKISVHSFAERNFEAAMAVKAAAVVVGVEALHQGEVALGMAYNLTQNNAVCRFEQPQAAATPARGF